GCEPVAPVAGTVAMIALMPTLGPALKSTITIPSLLVTPSVRPRVTSAGCRCEKLTAAFGTGRPAESVTRNDITPVSWMPDPWIPSTAGETSVSITAAAGPAGPPITGPASTGGGGEPPSPDAGEDGPTRVTCVPFATLDQTAVTVTLPAPQWVVSSVKSQEYVRVAWPVASRGTLTLLLPEPARLPPVTVTVTFPVPGCPAPSVTAMVMCARVPSLFREVTSDVTTRFPAEPPEVVELQAQMIVAAARTRSLRSRFTETLPGAPRRRGLSVIEAGPGEGQFFQ